MAKTNSNVSGIVLINKQSGLTSFSSLYAVKKALGTSRVGHTGTLDSFAQGLLVVCAGNLTRLASHIVAFDKTYEAVIEFGKETDTLDPEGKVIATADFPSLKNLADALHKFRGNIEQVPPSYSALRVNGKRASALMRSGETVELKKRPVSVYSSQILEVKFDDGTALSFDGEKNDDCKKIDENQNRKVHFARIKFEVSKGTYIRSLARDIGISCSSRAYLIGLLRTKIGCFELKDAASFEEKTVFTIESVISKFNSSAQKENPETMDIMIEKIKQKIQPMTPAVAETCGLFPVCITQENEKNFLNGRPLKKSMFKNVSDNAIRAEFAGENPDVIFDENQKYSVFSESGIFYGVISFEKKRICYEYVIPQNL
ncbi:MAG: tRNA pseudouridine(55) synthase TruB [Treponema sp.]